MNTIIITVVVIVIIIIIQMAKVPLTDEQIDKLMEKLDTDKNGEIDFS